MARVAVKRYTNPQEILSEPDPWWVRRMQRPISATIRGTGSYVPPRIVPNDEFTQSLDTTDEWILTRTGIRERRHAGPGDTAATMGTLAAREALSAAGVSPGDIDLMILTDDPAEAAHAVINAYGAQAEASATRTAGAETVS